MHDDGCLDLVPQGRSHDNLAGHQVASGTFASAMASGSWRRHNDAGQDRSDHPGDPVLRHPEPGTRALAFARRSAGVHPRRRPPALFPLEDRRLSVCRSWRRHFGLRGPGGRDDLAPRHRPTVVIALSLNAAELLQPHCHSLAFDALGHHRQIHACGQVGDRPHDLGRFRTGLDPLDKGTVDLDLVEGQQAQVVQRGVAGAKVVQRDLDAVTVERLRIRRAPSVSSIRAVSVISAIRRCGGKSARPRISRTFGTSWWSFNCTGAMLMASLISGSHALASCRARARSWNRRSLISPHSWAMGMNSSGPMACPSRRGHRASISKPIVRPDARSTTG